MPGFVYFDTDVFHRIGQTFATQGLRRELRERILLSPITILEVLSKLTLKKNSEILIQIQAIHNWVNPQHAGLLPWPSVAIANIGFQKAVPTDDFIDRIQETINLGLSTDSPEDFRDSADKLKNALDSTKDFTAQQFTVLVEMYRKDPLVGEKFAEVWADGIARRARVDPQSRPLKDIVSALSAYYEYEEERLKIAAKNPAYKPDRNDVLDSEQLIYLGDPTLHFVTCDGGYAARIKKSEQVKRIHRVPLDLFGDVAKVEALLSKVTA